MKITTKKNFRAFSDGSSTRKFFIAEDGVKAWDSVAGHYTRMHNLSGRQIAMIRAEAK